MRAWPGPARWRNLRDAVHGFRTPSTGYPDSVFFMFAASRESGIPHCD